MATTDSTKSLSPAEILAYNQAFADSLSTLDKVIEQQQGRIVNMVVDGLNNMIQLCKHADIKQAVENAVNEIKGAAAKVNTPAAGSAPASPGATTDKKDPSPAEAENEDWLKTMLNALNLAQENTINTQQQLNELGQAALTQLISSLMSIVDTVVAVQQAKE